MDRGGIEMSAASEYAVILVTAGSQEEAELLSRLLLEQKKAACVNILNADSLFWWEGAIESEHEKLLVAKSRTSLLPEIIELVRENHSYDVPEVIALPVIGGNRDYLGWIGESTNGKA
jgi:periplasmic divalent cation tolerance protein